MELVQQLFSTGNKNHVWHHSAGIGHLFIAQSGRLVLEGRTGRTGSILLVDRFKRRDRSDRGGIDQYYSEDRIHCYRMRNDKGKEGRKKIWVSFDPYYGYLQVWLLR